MFEKSIRTLKLVTLLALGLCALPSTPAHAAAPTKAAVARPSMT